jgi:Lon-like ATP-dependent protease
MLARAMTELLPTEELEDILIYPNPEDPNEPKIRTVPAGKGKEIVNSYKAKAARAKSSKDQLFNIMFIVVLLSAFAVFAYTKEFMILLVAFMAIFLLFMMSQYNRKTANTMIPKLLVSHKPGEKAPFVEATGSHSGALLGDVRHDPYQSGGLETPAHERVEPGDIQRAHRGVLYVDEINTLEMTSQQHLLTVLQEKKFSITGQSERSAGALVKTEPVPCDFILVAAGNLQSIQGMHPALRSRIRGYGYEVYIRNLMEDSKENRKKLVQFVSQEVINDGKIPHFKKEAVGEVIKEAQRRAGRKGKLTLRLRELGGLVRVSGDIAIEKKKQIVELGDVLDAKSIAKPLEQQVVDRYIEGIKDYATFRKSGSEVGMVNGLAVMGEGGGMNEYSGIVLPIIAEVTQAQSTSEGKIIATGKLGEIAKEAVQNVGAVIKKVSGKDISKYDIHVQFIGTYEGVEGDSASVSIATAIISALENVPVNQTVSMTGSLSVRGEILPVGGVTAKIEAAAKTGMKKALIPTANAKDVLIDRRYEGKIKVIPVSTITDVLEAALVGSRKKSLLAKISKFLPRVPPVGSATTNP